tara:strand:+ start:333 stop:452 length:120 start_codon:yes stop_codon:yes gene_type:complete
VLKFAQGLNKVNVENLPAGINILNLQVDGKVVSKKIIKD